MLIVYAYDETGDPEFYIVSGPLRDDATFEPSTWFGMRPIHGLGAPLFRVTDGRFVTRPVGPPPGPGGADFVARRVGFAIVTFAFHDGADIVIRLDAPPAGQLREGRNYVSRFNFACGAFGRNLIASQRSCWPDLRGQWVFVDESNPARVPWRFHFTEAAPFPANMVCPTNDIDNGVVFRDPSRNAELRCANRNLRPDPATGRIIARGCELWQGGEVLLSVSQPDLGLRRIVASPGALTPVAPGQAALVRKPERVLGFRVD